MYHIFFQPFEAVDIIKKGSKKAFVLMLLVASSLASLAITLFFTSSSLVWMKEITKSLPWSSWNFAQYFVVLLVTIYLANIVRAMLIHLVMKIFTEKGEFADAFKVSTVNCFLMSVYLLLAVIASAIPVVGLGLSAMVLTVGMLITISVSLKALSVLYKTDIITSCIAIVAIMIALMCAVHLSLFATMSANGLGKDVNGYSLRGPRMMQQWGTQNKGQYAYPTMMTPPVTSVAPVAPAPKK